jgi:hypothetical protein
MAAPVYEWGRSERKGNSKKLITRAPTNPNGSLQVYTWTSYRGAWFSGGEQKRLFRCTACQKLKEHAQERNTMPVSLFFFMFIVGKARTILF